MSIRAVVVGACVGLVLGVMPASAVAQLNGSTPNAGGEPKVRIATMYSYEHNFGLNSPFGFAFDFSETIGHPYPKMRIEVVGQFVWNHYSTEDGGSDVMFGGGTRFVLAPHGSLTPYFHIIAGLTHCCSQNWFTTQFGGGVDIGAKGLKNIKIRLEGNWVTIFDDPENGFRLNVGVVIPLGKK